MKYERKFFSAARDGDLKTVEEALAYGFPVDHLSKLKVNQENLSVTPGRTGLMWATIEGQNNVVSALLSAGASPDVREHTGLEAFADDENRFRDTWILAAESNQPEIMELLLRTMQRPTAKRLTNCLEHAAEHGSLEVVRLLLDEGVEIDGISIDGTTPLMAAASHGRPRVVEYLLQQGATLNLSDGAEIGTALNRCAFLLCKREFTIDREGNEVENSSTEEKLACLKLLLDAGADPNVEQAGLGYPLEQVAGNREAAQLLLDAGANPRLTGSIELPTYDASPDGSARERLMMGIETSNADVVSTVIAEGADVNEEDEDGYTPIMYAAYVGNMDLIKLLVENDADLNRWAHGDNVLNQAAYGGQREIYEYLHPLVSADIQSSVDEEELSRGELRRLRSADASVEAFIDAVNFKPIEMAQAAIKDGVNVNGIGSNGETALHYAAYWGKTGMIRLLIEFGADVNIRDIDDGTGLSSGSTPLNLAAFDRMSGNAAEAIDMLLAAGADPNIPNDSGRTPLMTAVYGHSSFCSTINSINRLVEAGTDLEIKDSVGSTALMMALYSDKEEIAGLLREAGASDFGVDDVALYKAASSGDVSAVRQLLSKNNINFNLSSPLAKASYNGHLAIVQALIDAGADVNQQDPGGGFSPLLSAAYGCHVDIVIYLLETGADVSITNGEGGHSALDYARIGQYESPGKGPWDEIVALLE